MVQNITLNYYHADGQIDEEDYVYGSFLQSKMFDEGVKCNDCHNVHTLQLKFEGNKLCLQCHVPEKYESETHHFHKSNTDASFCINCHITGKYYMGNDFRRDHSFRIPRPDQSELYDTPNACTICHIDKTNKCAAQAIIDNYGAERAPHFSEALLLSSKNTLSETQRNLMDVFINDLNYPEIACATVIENLNYSSQEQYQSLLVALNGIDKNNFIMARSELETMLFSNADFLLGRLLLGDYYFQNNDILNAIKHYEMVLVKDSMLLPVFSNLATAYSMNKNYQKAKETLDLWISLEPTNGRPHYLKGLLSFEYNNNDVAVLELKKAIDLDPLHTRSMYNLATFYFQKKTAINSAENYILSALKIEPNNQEYNYLLALIYEAQGKINQANQIMRKLEAN